MRPADDIDTVSELRLLTRDAHGVVMRVLLVLQRRGFAVDAFCAERVPGASWLRLSLAVRGDATRLSNVRRQLRRLVDVIEIVDCETSPPPASTPKTTDVSTKGGDPREFPQSPARAVPESVPAAASRRPAWQPLQRLAGQAGTRLDAHGDAPVVPDQ